MNIGIVSYGLYIPAGFETADVVAARAGLTSKEVISPCQNGKERSQSQRNGCGRETAETRSPQEEKGGVQEQEANAFRSRTVPPVQETPKPVTGLNYVELLLDRVLGRSRVEDDQHEEEDQKNDERDNDTTKEGEPCEVF